MRLHGKNLNDDLQQTDFSDLPESKTFALVKGWHLTFQLWNPLWWPISNINSTDETKLPCYIPPLAQHHSFYRNLSPLLIWMTTFQFLKGQTVQKGLTVLSYITRYKIILKFNISLQLLGMAVFAFMCHHSVPSIILPLADKRKTLQVVLVDYVIVLFYCGIIVFSAVLNKPASAILPLYTLNFSDHSVTVLAKFLSLYPVFTLSSNFPLICITLRNNLMALFPVSKVIH